MKSERRSERVGGEKSNKKKDRKRYAVVKERLGYLARGKSKRRRLSF